MGYDALQINHQVLTWAGSNIQWVVGFFKVVGWLSFLNFGEAGGGMVRWGRLLNNLPNLLDLLWQKGLWAG